MICRKAMRRASFTASAGIAALIAAGSAQAQTPAQAQEPGAGASDVTTAAANEEEVIYVTAQRRTQRLIDVPQSVSAVGEETLERQQARSFLDYAALVPGLGIDQSTPGEARITLRGINTGSVGSTAAVYFDETPFGSSSALGNAAVLASDFDTFDMARIEVVRGPQGTLYGSNALGGVLKFVTNAPNPSFFSGRLQAGLEAVESGGLGWNANAMLNQPLGHSAAVRASGFYRENPGFIDRIGLPGEDVNDSRTYGGRVSLLVEPTAGLSVRLTAFAQNIEAGAGSSFDADPQTFRPITVDPFTGTDLRGRLVRTEHYPVFNNVDYRLLNGTAHWDIGLGTLTSVTSFGKLRQHQETDNTGSLGGLVTFLYGSPTPLGIFLDAVVDQEKFTQEVRLASRPGGPLEWLVGGYYTDESVALLQNFVIFEQGALTIRDPALLGQPSFAEIALLSSYEEIAGFGNVTVHITPQWEASVGGRLSHNRQRADQSIEGAFVLLTGGVPPQLSEGRSSESVFTWSLSSLYRLTPNASVYVRAAKGYRPGGPNVVPPGAGPNFPFQFDADTIVSYELGVHMQTPDRLLALDAAAFYQDWNDIQVFAQVQTDVGPVGVNANGEGARSWGLEASATLRPARGFNILANLAWTNAELTADTPAITGGRAGDRLPFVPELAGSLSVDYEFPIHGSAEAFLGATARIVGSQAGNFSPAYRTAFGAQPNIRGYEALDLRAGIQSVNWSITAFVRNVTDAQSPISVGGFTAGLPISVAPLRPLTFGVTVGTAF
jgi:iron complex outermembrane recepter protein